MSGERRAKDGEAIVMRQHGPPAVLRVERATLPGPPAIITLTQHRLIYDASHDVGSIWV